MTENLLEGSEEELSDFYDIGNSVIESIYKIEKNTTDLIEILKPSEEEEKEELEETSVLSETKEIELTEEELQEEETEIIQSPEELILIEINEQLTTNNELIVEQNELIQQSIKTDWTSTIILSFVVFIAVAVAIFVKEISKW